MSTENSARISGHIVLVSSLLLLVTVVLIQVSSTAFNPLILVAQMIPLALTLPGLINKSSRSMQWLCFVVLFFLVQGILTAFTPGRLWVGLTETAICLIVFFSAIIFIGASRKEA